MKKEPLSIIAVKTLLAVIIFAGVGTIIIGGGLLIGKQKDNKSNEILPTICKDNFSCPSGMKCKNYICVNVGCVKEGEITPGTISPDSKKHMATECCKGLKKIKRINEYDENCNSVLWWGGGSLCSNCSNGVCEEWESKCNCPEDCK